MFWLSLFLAALAAVLCGVLVFRFVTTAVIVVHPWHLGFGRSEEVATLRETAAISGGSWDVQATLRAHEEYYARLAVGIRRIRARHVILLDSYEHSRFSYERLAGLIRPSAQLVFVQSRPGVATPEEMTWEGLIHTLSFIRIRRIYVIGSYLGLHEGELVDPGEVYFCVNDVVTRLQRSGAFVRVNLAADYCYIQHINKFILLRSRRDRATRRRNKSTGRQRTRRNRKKRG